MVAITTLTGYALHASGSAARQNVTTAQTHGGDPETPAIIITSDRAQRHAAEATAAQAVTGIFRAGKWRSGERRRCSCDGADCA